MVNTLQTCYSCEEWSEDSYTKEKLPADLQLVLLQEVERWGVSGLT